MISKSKYIAAESLETAAEKAAQHFGCDKARIILEEVIGTADSPEPQFFAFVGTHGEFANLNAGFALYYEADGVYLEIYEERGLGREFNRAALERHVSRKNITKYNESAAHSLVAKRAGRAMIAPAQQEFFFGEDIEVEISDDELQARAKLLAPEPGGAMLEFEEAKQKLSSAGVKHGIDENALHALLDEKKYGESFVVAAATLPVDGENGKLIFHFQTDKLTSKPKEIEGGKVDYKSLDLYVPVNKGQLLVSKTLETEGTPGKTVKGKPLIQRLGKPANLPKGKNVTVNDQKTEMYARSPGMVEFVNDSVNVSNLYKIDGDVDISVGNIDFDGSVHIKGNVLAGHVIKATGGVVVGGVVEASEIIAGGNVEIKRGMQGVDKGRIESAGSISLMYIERGKAVAGGSVTVDACIHSVIEAGETLQAKGKRGSIIGGRAIVSGEIIAKSIGSVSHVQTEIEVGIIPYKRERLSFLEKELERLSGEMIKLDQLDAYIEKAKAKLDAATFEKLYRSGKENRLLYTEQLEAYTSEMSDLTYELENATIGKVHVHDTVHEGVRITMASDTFKVNDDIQYATFKYKDGKVVYGPYEAKA